MGIAVEQIGEDFATARKLGAAEIGIFAQFLPPGEAGKDRSNGRSLEDSKAGVRAFSGSKPETPGLPEKKSDVITKMRRAGRVTLR